MSSEFLVNTVVPIVSSALMVYMFFHVLVVRPWWGRVQAARYFEFDGGLYKSLDTRKFAGRRALVEISRLASELNRAYQKLTEAENALENSSAAVPQRKHENEILAAHIRIKDARKDFHGALKKAKAGGLNAYLPKDTLGRQPFKMFLEKSDHVA